MPNSDVNGVTSVITGRLVLTFDKVDWNGCRSICIQRDDEEFPADDQGRKPLRGVKLSKQMTDKFDAALNNAIFKGKTVLDITVSTGDLEADLAKGRGVRGYKYPYFDGIAVTYQPV